MNARNDSHDLTRVGPGTVMGEFMRQYWIPALRGDELAAGGDPVRLMLLGEKLIAFRDHQGRVGVMDHRCPHRCASLFLARNEPDGIRCIYHGWQFDVTGRCVDMPSVSPANDFKDKVHAKAYPATERCGIFWVYMGSSKEPPPLPMVEATLLPEDQVDVGFMRRDCNWMQALEGDIDTSHFGFLHVGHLDPDNVPPGHPLEHTAGERAPDYHVADAPWGTTYGAFRNVPNGKIYWRFANYMFPFWTQTPQGEFSNNIQARAWVPLDDGHTQMLFIRRRVSTPGTALPLKDGKPLGGSKPRPDMIPNGTGWLDRWRLQANEGNDWLLDREAQRSNRIYSGIDNIQLQDQAVCESMGAITDHTFEHLGPGDLMIARTRRRALMAARAFRGGAPAPLTREPEIYSHARSGFFELDPGKDWRAAYDEQVAAAQRAPGVATGTS